MAQVLVADVGGTNARLRIVDLGLSSLKNGQKIIAHKEYLACEYNSFVDIVNDFIAESFTANNHAIKAACIAVAGVVENDVVKMTNVPWSVSKVKLQEYLNCSNVCLLNDFEAAAYGVLMLNENDYITIQQGESNHCTNTNHNVKALLGAGTGLGVSFVHSIGDQTFVQKTEGGHATFAPSCENEIELLKYLRLKLSRVSNERLLSGSGIINIYNYLRDNYNQAMQENQQLTKLLHDNPKQASYISTYALQHNDPLALRTLQMFVAIYASVAGDVALNSLPYGGLYIAGGIAPRFIDLMKSDIFLSNFSNKGRMSATLRSIPIKLVTNLSMALQGASYYAKVSFDI